MRILKKVFLIFLPFGLLAMSLGVFIFLIRSNNQNYADTPTAEVKHADVQGLSTTKVNPFDKNQYSTTDLNSLWVIITPANQIPKNYTPDDLQPIQTSIGTQILVKAEIAKHVDALVTSAQKENLAIKPVSGYRDYNEQRTLYASRADKTAAKPGLSEHQLGLAIDVTTGDNENIWLSNHAHKYGFIIRYPKDKELITGMAYEPWHLRYVGVGLATEIKAKNMTLEEYFKQ